MSGRTVSIHSYRGGTGKSNLTANIAACMVDAGKRVAALDCDITSPGVHLLFGVDSKQIQLSIVDYLFDKCSIEETAYDVTGKVALPGSDNGGRCWLVPAAMNAKAITRIIDQGYDLNRLGTHLDELVDTLNLDFLLIDTHPGVSKETMLTTALSDELVVIVRPDQQDYYGTAVVLELAGKLEVPHIMLVANKVLGHVDQAVLKQRLEEAFHCPVIGMATLSEDLASVESRGLFVRRFPDHDLTRELREITQRIIDA